ncbi:DUF4231 domain-containing protein [Actinoplanes sp. NPDC049265]|uniref:DUF4231 domain-containing protein n=1 Tax=Actinoplanes sp. NPDC049265 TaxID=3363902 RepID=UPI0037183A90
MGESFTLQRKDLPELYRVGSAHSAKGRQQSARWLAVQLALLSAGAGIGAIDGVKIGALDLGAASAVAALLLSLVPATWLAMRNPQRSWYEGRAAAESIKTLVWKYSVRAQPFDHDDESAVARLTSDFAAVRSEISSIAWPSESMSVTPAMQQLRDSALAERKNAYLTGRLAEERTWYTAKARRHRQMHRMWSILVFGATAVGLLTGALDAFGVVSYDGLGAATAAAAGATAWLQMKQHRPLATAYELTGRDLAAASRTLASIEEERDWARRAEEAEEAVSREHTMWIARREAA